MVIVIGLVILAAICVIAYRAAEKPAARSHPPRRSPQPVPASKRPSPAPVALPAQPPATIDKPRPDAASQRAAVARHLGQKYLARQDQLRAEVDAERRQLDAAFRRSATSLDFDRLVALHRASYRVADASYAHLTDTRTALRAIGDAIGSMKAERDRRYRARQPFNDIRLALDGLHSDRKALTAYRDSFEADVDALNSQTRDLKLRIRDSCGARGRIWYAELEQRTAERRANP